MSSPITDITRPDVYPHNENVRYVNSEINHAISGLKSCLHLYQEKAKNCEKSLEQMKCSMEDVPGDVKNELQNLFNDENGVFSFNGSNSKEIVSINPSHVLDSLQTNYEVSQLKMLESQQTDILEEYIHLEDVLQRNLESEKHKDNEMKIIEKQTQAMIFKRKLEEKQRELQNLKKLSEASERPKYSLKELETLKQNLNKLEVDLTHAQSKLDRYNNLPLNEKGALNQLNKLRDELLRVDIQIKRKISG